MWPKTATMCNTGVVPESSKGTGTTMCAPKRVYLRVLCAWCGKFMHLRPGYGVTGDSHGMCPACEDEIQRTVQ